jgi:hypothetical protein
MHAIWAVVGYDMAHDRPLATVSTGTHTHTSCCEHRYECLDLSLRLCCHMLDLKREVLTMMLVLAVSMTLTSHANGFCLL